MAVTINADTTNGLVLTPDTSGEIKLQSAGTDIATVSSTGITMAAGKTLPATSLTTATGSAPSYSARAWVNFNGTGTVAIRDSGNVSSITDNGTGDYTVNFTTAMLDANYTATISVRDSGGWVGIISSGTLGSVFTTTSIRVETYSPSAGSNTDNDYIGVTILR